MSAFYAALEIGTTRTVLAIGEADGAGKVKVTCHAAIPSAGVRKSQIVDIPQATQCIRGVLAAIDKKQDEAGISTTVGNVYLVINGRHVGSISAPGMTQLRGKITAEDLAEAFNHAQTMPIPEGRELLDLVEQDYAVDERGGVVNPKGMSGHLLKLNTLQIVADKNRIQDAYTAAGAANLDICEPVFAVTCAADAVLEDRERKSGVLVLDLGGGSTGYAVYADGYLNATGVIGVGGDHVSNDIAAAFQTSHTQAEELKLTEANAVLVKSPGALPRVKIPSSSPVMESRTLSRVSLDTVTNARLRELFLIVRETLEKRDLLGRLSAGVVLTGGGAQMRGVQELVEQTLGLRVRLGTPINVSGLDDTEFAPAYATIAGALLYAVRNDESRGSFIDSIKRIFK